MHIIDLRDNDIRKIKSIGDFGQIELEGKLDEMLINIAEYNKKWKIVEK